MNERAKLTAEQIIPAMQLRTVRALIRGEEGEWFKTRVGELLAIADAMPRTYEQEGKGDDAVVGLHYFAGGCDWWITELDVDTDGEGQQQAFGLVRMNGDPELGYISLIELCSCNVELDFHWNPKTLGKIREGLVR